MILDEYVKQVDSLTTIVEDIIRQVRINAAVSSNFSREAYDMQLNLSETLFECYMSFKEVKSIKKKLNSLVKRLESCEYITQEIRNEIIEDYFSPSDSYPISMPVSNYLMIIRESFAFQKVSSQAFMQIFSDTPPDMPKMEAERDLKKQEIENDYESYLRYMDEVLGMIHEKKEPIDILIYLKQSVL